MSRIVQQILEYHLQMPLKDILPEMTVDELNIDSLDAIEICMDIEDKFAIQITDAELEAVKSVQDLYDLVNRKQDEKQAHLMPKQQEDKSNENQNNN